MVFTEGLQCSSAIIAVGILESRAIRVQHVPGKQALKVLWGVVQALAAAVLPTAAVYILEQQARWRFVLNEIKRRA